MSSSKDKDAILVPTVREVQQKFAEILSHGEDITWDLLSQNQGDVLKGKLSLFESNSNMFHWIWDQRKYTNGQSLTSLFFVMIVNNVCNTKLAEQSRSWRLYPVFRCRRCVDKSGQSSSIDCCMAYVTQNSVCGNWKEFLMIPGFLPGVMVAPDRGVYKLIDGQVELKTYTITDGQPGFLRHLKDYSITPESLTKASQTPIDREKFNPGNSFGVTVKLALEFSACERMLNLLLNPDKVPQSCDAIDLSDSLALFTQNANNFRLASTIMKEKNSSSNLANQQRTVFNTIFKESERIEGKVDLIRSVNGVPTKLQLDKFLQPTQKKRKQRKLSEKTKDPEDVGDNPSESTTIKVNGEDINLEVYGTVLKDHILSLESFEILITSMSEHLEPEMFKLILQLTQTFVENTREEMCQQLRYYFSTESVLHQIILSIKKHHPNWDFNEIEEQSSDIIRRVRFYFASSDPNSRIEFLKKCDKCSGYYDLFDRS